MQDNFPPFHINATCDDLAGNNGLGRYVFLPGSDGRAKQIAEHFTDVNVKPHPRGHNLYLGTITTQDKKIDVATIASGMGCPSMEIILHELFNLGARRFLRVGTAGSLQPSFVKLGDIVHVNASVRDERTTMDYVPLGMPAIASFEFTMPILKAAKKLGLAQQIHSGIVHCKSSFYARQFGAGPQVSLNNEYIKLLTDCGVLASEMETAALFVQSQLYNHQLRHHGKGNKNRVISGAVLAIIASIPREFATDSRSVEVIEKLILLSIETIKNLASEVSHADALYELMD